MKQTKTRVCTKCKLRQFKNQFSPCAKGKDGLHPHCKSCKVEAMREYRKQWRLVVEE